MNVPEFLRGTIAPVLTVFKEDESFDEVGQRNLLDYMLAPSEVGAYFIRSGMGQMYSYLYDDVFAVAHAAADHLAGKAPFLLNCSGIWDGERDAGPRPDSTEYTEQALVFEHLAEEVEAAGVVHVVPEALLRGGDGGDLESVYLTYFETVCGGTDLPVLVYQPPGVPEMAKLTPDLLARLADLPNLVGGKISTTDAYYMFDLMRAVKDKTFHVVTGSEMIYFATVQAGSRAVIGLGCNVFPRILNALLKRFEEDDRAGVLDAQESINLLFKRCPYARVTMKRLATDAGYPVGLTYRGMGANPYGVGAIPCTEENYRTYKQLRAEELDKYL